MDDHDKTFFYMVIFTTIALVVGIALASLDRKDITDYDAKNSQY